MYSLLGAVGDHLIAEFHRVVLLAAGEDAMGLRRWLGAGLRYLTRCFSRRDSFYCLLGIVVLCWVYFWYHKSTTSFYHYFPLGGTTTVRYRVQPTGQAFPPKTSPPLATWSEIGFQSLPVSELSWSYEAPNGRASVFAKRGIRPSMEDRFAILSGHRPEMTIDIYSIFDGHGGQRTAELAEEYLLDSVASRVANLRRSSQFVNWTKILTEEVVTLDQRIFNVSAAANHEFDQSGSTALVAVHLSDTKQLVVANLGDSRGVMGGRDGTVVPVSTDHKPNDPRELSRIKSLGGNIQFFGVWRVQGILATSRALGDFFIKTPKPYVNSVPEISKFDLAKDRGGTFLILATDGLWDVVTNQEAVDLVNQSLKSNSKDAKDAAGDDGDSLEPADLTIAAELLVNTALDRGSTDNVSVMLVKIVNGNDEDDDAPVENDQKQHGELGN